MNEMKVVESGLVPVYENEGGERVVDARELHEFLEVGKDFSTWIKDRIERYGFEEGGDYVVCSPNLGSKDGRGGHNANDYLLSMECAKEIAMVENNEQGQRIRKYFIECERRLKEVQRMHAQVAATCPQTYSEALRALANVVEMKELAEKQRDEAARTKAWIEQRREATAMATASAATRRAEKLAEQIGDSTKWKTVKSIPWILQYFEPSRGMWSSIGMRLKKISANLGLDVRSVEDSAWGHVNTYHIDAIEEFKGMLDKNPTMMEPYRVATLPVLKCRVSKAVDFLNTDFTHEDVVRESGVRADVVTAVLREMLNGGLIEKGWFGHAVAVFRKSRNAA